MSTFSLHTKLNVLTLYFRKREFIFSQNSATTPLEIISGSKYREGLCNDTGKIWKLYEFLYNNEKFDLWEGWTKQMVQILYRETVHGRLLKMYKTCLESCPDNDFNNLDLKLISTDLMKVVLSSGCHKV